jgi:hypothetical protein
MERGLEARRADGFLLILVSVWKWVSGAMGCFGIMVFG